MSVTDCRPQRSASSPAVRKPIETCGGAGAVEGTDVAEGGAEVLGAGGGAGAAEAGARAAVSAPGGAVTAAASRIAEIKGIRSAILTIRAGTEAGRATADRYVAAHYYRLSPIKPILRDPGPPRRSTVPCRHGSGPGRTENVANSR